MKKEFQIRRAGMLAVLVLVACVVIADSKMVSAQESEMKVGLSASVQSGQTDILIPLRWEKFMIAPSVRLVSISEVAKDLGFGAAVRFYFREGTASPYFGFRAGVLILEPDEGEGVTDVVVGPAVGGEVFLHDNLSVGDEAQINVAFSDKNSLRFNNPDGTTINTAAALLATFYF